MARQKLIIAGVLLASTALAGAAWADPVTVADKTLDGERLEAGIYPSAPMPEGFAVPDEPAHPPFELDWSIGLKGSYTAATGGNSFVTTLNPAFTATHQGVRTDLVLNGGASLARNTDGTLGVTGLNLQLDAVTALGRDTTASGSARIGLSQDLPGAPGANPLVEVPPQVLTAALSGAVERRFGRFDLSVTGDLERTLYGPTTRTDTGLTDNSADNVWQGDVGLRLGVEATPIFDVFTQADIGRDWFDQAGTSGIKNDATSRSLRGGVSGSWNGLLSASASVGVGQHDFDDAGLTDITTRLYDASIAYSPDTTLNLTAALSTTIEPTGADVGGTARVAHIATASASYTVNSWLRLRASADWGLSTVEGSGETERRHGFGAGADYKFNSRTALSADYAYSHRDNSLNGVTDSHSVSLGVTLKR
ncbi:hypothetical protein SAMN06295905_3227 [Devosia lucknowensis]|uniref:Beta-barrel porin 2 n=1 Tax=Devosia lucknowensis TaxID=1096929 RepID=A0A1Y6G6Y9_9HYPH|nr:outer membrane beta-barrel protein [Devosia lucknowensis]SMQ85932.1 hypothetical protein SAMN06295905_3227 [Devosia lucknowensis]